MRIKLYSIETNFQVSTANTVPVISLQNKIVNNSLIQTKIKFGGNFKAENMLKKKVRK